MCNNVYHSQVMNAVRLESSKMKGVKAAGVLRDAHSSMCKLEIQKLDYLQERGTGFGYLPFLASHVVQFCLCPSLEMIFETHVACLFSTHLPTLMDSTPNCSLPRLCLKKLDD